MSLSLCFGLISSFEWLNKWDFSYPAFTPIAPAAQ